MPQVKRAAKGKRPNKAVSVLGIAGVSLAASTKRIASGYTDGVSGIAPCRIGSRSDLQQDAASFRLPTLDEEEISDVSLATFRLFDKDDLGNSQSGIQVAFRGCGGGCGCHGGGFLRLRGRLPRLRRWLSRLQRLRRWLSRLRLWRVRLRRLRVGLGLGAAAAACHGEVAPLC